MYFKQFFLGCLAHASYFIADEKSRIAAVVDPQRDIDEYLAEAQNGGFEIKHVFLTHFHADFLSGHLELKEACGATIYLGSKAAPDYPFVPLKDKDTIEFGDVCIEAMETPGHTPESVCYVIFDRSTSKGKPHAVLTGDTLFVGDVGRPDLMVASGRTAEELAGALFDSLHDKLLKLPDDTLVYPAHGAGSMCGKNLGKESFTTIGEQKRLNYALQANSKEEFVSSVCADQIPAPPYFRVSAELNQRERRVLRNHLSEAVKPLSLESVLAMENAQILDTRGPSDFARGHLRGSINIGLSGNYASWAGTVLDHVRPIVIVAAPGKEEESALRLGRIGYDNVVGYLDEGPSAFLQVPDLVWRIERVTAAAADSEIRSGARPVVLDVRTESEWRRGHVEGSLNIPLQQLCTRIGDVPTGQRLIVHCLGGYRSMIASSILASRGITDIVDVIGGFNAWLDSGLPTVKPSGASESAVCSG